MNLIFVRHGQSVWNLDNKFTGWVDIGLSENGVKGYLLYVVSQKIYRYC